MMIILDFVAIIFFIFFAFFVYYIYWIEKPPKKESLSSMSRIDSVRKLKKLIGAIEKSGTMQFHLQNAEISESEWQEVKNFINIL